MNVAPRSASFTHLPSLGLLCIVESTAPGFACPLDEPVGAVRVVDPAQRRLAAAWRQRLERGCKKSHSMSTAGAVRSLR